MAAVRSVQEVGSKDVDLDATHPHLTGTKTGDEVHLDDRDTPTGSCHADVVGNNSVCESIRDDDERPLLGEACASAVSDDRTCTSTVAQCNHVGDSNSLTELSRSASPAMSSSDICAVTNTIVDTDRTEQGCAPATNTDVNNPDPVIVSHEVAVTFVSGVFEQSGVVAQSMSTVEGTIPSAVLKDVLVESAAPGSPHSVTVPSIRTNVVNMVMPTAVTSSTTLRTLAPRIVVSTSPATTVLRVQTAAGNVSTQPLTTVPSQRLILPVRNQGTAVPRV